MVGWIVGTSGRLSASLEDDSCESNRSLSFERVIIVYPNKACKKTSPTT